MSLRLCRHKLYEVLKCFIFVSVSNTFYFYTLLTTHTSVHMYIEN